MLLFSPNTLLDFFLRINLPLFSTVVPAIIFVFLSVAITTLSTGLMGVKVTSIAGTKVENKGKLILREVKVRVLVQVQIFLLKYDNVNVQRHKLCFFSLNDLN